MRRIIGVRPLISLLVSLGGPAVDVVATVARIRERAQLSQAIPIVIFCIPTVAEGAEVEIDSNVYLTRPDNFDQLRALLHRLLNRSALQAEVGRAPCPK